MSNHTLRTASKTLSRVALVALIGTTTLAGTRAARATEASDAARADIQKTLGFVPQFFLKFPATVLPGAWEEMKTLQLNPKTALPGKTKELIGLAVSAQVPCRYCIYAHTEFARLGGASTAELGEAVGMAALTRHWSTFLNGIQTDPVKWRAEVSRIVDGARKAKPPAAGAKPATFVDGQGALADITQTLGFAPDFLKRFPGVARAGAWREFKDLQMSSATSLSGKDKELIGLAVASQVPCQFCVVAHTEFARLNGASDAEIDEAIAMASLTRNMSTMLNGLQVDDGQFQRDIEHLVKGARAVAARAQKGTK